MANFQKAIGTISRIEPSRDFIDGVYCKQIDIIDIVGKHHQLANVFFTLKLSAVLKSAATGEFYFWNSHCYAFRSDQDFIEDIEGARASYFRRDAGLLVLMAVSVVLLPVALFVLAKKAIRGSSRRQMELFMSAERG
jgi:hypothetical protein